MSYRIMYLQVRRWFGHIKVNLETARLKMKSKGIMRPPLSKCAASSSISLSTESDSRVLYTARRCAQTHRQFPSTTQGTQMSRPLLMLHIILISSVSGCWTLRITDKQIPVYKLRGEDAVLSCNYDLENDSLYSFKWYKDDEEFYRYMPSKEQPQQIFKRDGVFVRPLSSNASRVVLKDLSFKSSGWYRCEVSAEASYNTLNHFGRLLVVELPNQGPRITGVQEKYVAGDYLRANCTAAKSHPAATLSWFINGQAVLPEHTRGYMPIRFQDGLETSILGIHLRLRNDHFSGGLMRLRCTATVAALYTRSDQDFIGENPVMEPIVLEKLDSLVSVNCSPSTKGDGWDVSGSVLWSLLLLLLLRNATVPAFHRPQNPSPFVVE